jgi:hypothetical protein
MTIGTEQDALIELLSNPFPATSIAFAGDTELLSVGFEMVKL